MVHYAFDGVFSSILSRVIGNLPLYVLQYILSFIFGKGMGLYIAKTIAEKHKVELEIPNRKDSCGAMVSLVFKSKKGRNE